jgi:hypothetical protein
MVVMVPVVMTRVHTTAVRVIVARGQIMLIGDVSI